MGRTKRIRRRRKTGQFTNFQSLDHISEIIELNIWLKFNGFRSNNSLGLGSFLQTGRGVVAKANIQQSEKLIDIPLGLMISVFTILTDNEFNSLFSNNHIYKLSSFQELLSFYITFLKTVGKKSFWYTYLQSLPQCYSVPYFLPDDIKQYLDRNTHSIIQNQKVKIESSFEYFCKILGENKSGSELVEYFKKHFSMEVYEWAYFTVNTRCVHIQASQIIDKLDSSFTDKPANKCYNDEPNLALCPYLDMFNHCKEVRTITKLVRTNGNKSIIKDTDTLFCEYNYQLFTCNSVQKYCQVFICYGESNNLKLVTEYGFYIPKNNLDSYIIQFRSLLEYMKECKYLKFDKSKYALIKNHGLNKNIYIDCNGLSFNFLSTMYILLSTGGNEKAVLKDVYSSNHKQCVKVEIFNLLRPFFINELNSLRQNQLNLMNTSDESYTLKNCINMYDRFIEIILKVM